MSDLSNFYGPNAGYVLDLYDRYRHDPASVDAATRAFFETWTPPSAETETAPVALSSADIKRIAAVARVTRLLRERGHLAAHIDPLGSEPPGDPALELSTHGLTPADLAALPPDVVGGPQARGAQNALEALRKLRVVYSGPIGYETGHIQNAEEHNWLYDAIESRQYFEDFTPDTKRGLLERLTEVDAFEQFIHKTFKNAKRFSIEGADMLVPMLDEIIDIAALAGTREVVLGMAHRGRLNVLTHVLGKPYVAVLTEFKDTQTTATDTVSGHSAHGWTGDVKYHLGARRDYTAGIVGMPVTLVPNPSHLEYVNPVVVGHARAAQEQRNRPGPPTQDEKASLPVLIHGDAAFPGQGIVAETLNLSRIPGYRTGGAIHIIVNNQIGFTTLPGEGRSTLYASDLAKGFEIPIVHVNADNPLACIAAARLAHAYRERFRKDFLIDLVGYRRYGHNEGDQPAYTQPRMYEIIENHPRVRDIWARELEQEQIVSRDEAEAMVRTVQQELQEAKNALANTPDEDSTPPATPRKARVRPLHTGVPAERLIEYNDALLVRPAGFTVNPTLENRVLKRRQTALLEPGGIDWGHAEALAFASILADGAPIRLSGQDTERGTFGHRNAVLHDPVTGKLYTPLDALPAARASFAVYNSPLSENAALGFEYGYSIQAPGVLVLWEAQYGDFANSAQVMIDQFLVSGAAKWRQIPSLVLLLPHGYEGAGPEHSSARLERYLQLCANDNIRVVNCTTSAQFFHLLRRQAALLETDPRPLVVMTPKSLLRNPLAGSSLSDLTQGAFQPVLDDAEAHNRADQVTRLILCSGKIYVDLFGALAKEDYPDADRKRIALARVEELYPFPDAELRAVFEGYPNLQEVVWAQEEPCNMGAWTFIGPRLKDPSLARWSGELVYRGRPEAASPAEGTKSLHDRAQNRLIASALRDLPALPMKRNKEGVRV